MRKLWIAIIGIIVVIAAVGGGAVWYMSTQIEALSVVEGVTGFHGIVSGHNYIVVEVKNTGAKTVEIYEIDMYNITATFTQDIVIPPGAQCRITFYVDGGPVTIENVAGTTTGGGNAVTNSPNNPWPLQGTTWFTASLRARSGAVYEKDHVGPFSD